MQKKKWERPQLIVLFRGKPEEAVLNGCKGPWTTGYAYVAGNCMYGGSVDGTPWCANCDKYAET